MSSGKITAWHKYVVGEYIANMYACAWNTAARRSKAGSAGTTVDAYLADTTSNS